MTCFKQYIKQLGMSLCNELITISIPLEFNDSRFIDMTEFVTPQSIPNNQTRTNWSIVEASGQPSVSFGISSKLRLSRIDSRECLRGFDGSCLIDECWARAIGIGEDHADTLQAFSPGSRGGIIEVTNSYLECGGAQNGAFFVADNWGGTIIIRNSVLKGGNYGLFVYSDPTCHIDIYCEDVYFVGPFGFGPVSVAGIGGGTYTIQQWDDVVNASIVDNTIIPGSLIPSP